MSKREFTLAQEYGYNHSSPLQWIISHIMRYPLLPLGMILGSAIGYALQTWSRVLVGDAFRWVGQSAPDVADLLRIAVMVALARLADGVFGLGRNWCVTLSSQRMEKDAREEFYVSLLGKSLTFHGRQRVGDLMARAINDVRQLNFMISPGLSLVADSAIGVIVPIVTIATIEPELTIVPIIFLALLAITLKDYTRRLNPVSDAMRSQFGEMNAGLEETMSGIEVVKVNAQEEQEEARFGRAATAFRDLFIERGEIQAKYWPFLVFGVCYALSLAHALYLYGWAGRIDVGDVVAFMGIVGVLRHPTFLSLFSFMLVQMGVSGAERILELINTETELDENKNGVSRPIEGHVEFRDVSFGYGEGGQVLKEISFVARPGETIAIVGATGSGKTTLTRLINRVFDAWSGQVLVDGIDVRDWQMQSLRSQISTIEQDVFLFSRPIAENIAFGVGQQATQEEIEACARQAQAHQFIMGFEHGYETEVGERGVTLSGGQRQRIAIARAFLADPRILVLDDSTSAIDSATEDEIQRAMYHVQEGRTTFLITHRLSQIRWADRILVLRGGELIDQGSHDELLERSADYRRIFAS